MQRETIQFTPENSKDVFTLKTYITQLEKREINKSFPTNQNDISMEIINKLENETIKQIIVKMNDETDGEKILAHVLNYPADVYSALYKKVKGIADGTEKKTS